jgi:hypothetical protein
LSKYRCTHSQRPQIAFSFVTTIPIEVESPEERVGSLLDDSSLLKHGSLSSKLEYKVRKMVAKAFMNLQIDIGTIKMNKGRSEFNSSKLAVKRDGRQFSALC